MWGRLWGSGRGRNIGRAPGQRAAAAYFEHEGRGQGKRAAAA